jgi:integrase
MSGTRFTSAFAADLEGYLAFKQNMGCYGASRIWYLRQFDAWCAEHSRTVFDQGTVEGWVRARLESSGRYRSWMSYIRDFGRWLQATGHDDACVLSDRWRAPFNPPRPYLLSRQEIEQFFTAAATLQTSSPWRWQAAAFFTLMHSCGLRTGEARALQTGQVDLQREHIDIVWSKGNRSRRLPVTPQVARVLDACDQQSRARFPGRANFFVSGTGSKVSPCTAGTMFARIWDEAGLARPSDGRQPVPYDFRHHFAYACIERWRIQGKDVHAMLPYLSRYMGHASFDSTYYYIHTSPDFLDAYDHITKASQELLPEVGFG